MLHSLDIRPYTFSYSELRAATQDFDPSNKLGEGGFGPVFKVRVLNCVMRHQYREHSVIEGYVIAPLAIF